jgi:hypothetical protein
VRSAVFSPDGKSVLTASDDNTPRFGMSLLRWKPLSIIPSWWCRAASRQNSAKTHSSIRSRHVGAFNRNGHTGSADCADRPRQRRAELILRSQYGAPAPSGPHHVDPNRICGSQHLKRFNRRVYGGDLASHPDNLIAYFVLEGFDRLSFETAAGAGRKVFCLFWCAF